MRRFAAIAVALTAGATSGCLTQDQFYGTTGEPPMSVGGTTNSIYALEVT